MTWLHKLVIGNVYIRYTPFWWWYRLICHSDYRLDDRFINQEFWQSLNHGWLHVEYIYKFEEYWGQGTYPPERIVLSQKDYDSLRERLLQPPDPEVQERVRKLMEKVPPWEK